MARILFADDDHAMGDLARLALQAEGPIIKLVLLFSGLWRGVSFPASVSGNVRGMLTKPISREELRSAVLSALE